MMLYWLTVIGFGLLKFLLFLIALWISVRVIRSAWRG